MKRKLTLAALCVAAVLIPTSAHAAGHPPDTGEYIVTLRSGDVKAKFNGELKRTYRHALNGGLVKLSKARAAELARDPAVVSVSPNATGRFTAVCGPAPCPVEVNANSWGLDYIDGRTSTLDGKYHYDVLSKGTGVTVYVLDSGIGDVFVPAEFGGRAVRGPNFRSLGGHEYPYWPHTDSRDDCSGHGTGVAGIIGSSQWGVARGASIQVARIGTACDDLFGQFFVSDVLDALDWVMDQHRPGDRSIINFSATVGAGNAELDAAFSAAIQAGITVVAAAGNDNENSCTTASPQRVPAVINVGAHTLDTGKADFSNFGPCVDLYAPGKSIRTTSHFVNQSVVVSGTSFSAPHVAGLAARFMGEWELFAPSPATVEATLKHNATTGSGTSNAHGSWYRQPSVTCEVSDRNDTVLAIPATGSVDSSMAIGGCYDDVGFGQRFVGKVRVSYALDHPRAADLKIELVSPGASPTVYPVRNPGTTWPPSSGIHEINVVDMPRLGTWKLRLTDTVSGQTGNLYRWFITF